MPDPTLSIFNPGSHLGAVSEEYALAVNQYHDLNPQRLIRPRKKRMADWPEWLKKSTVITSEQFKHLMQTRYMQALVDPGEAVGLLASQGYVKCCRMKSGMQLMALSVLVSRQRR